MQVQPTQTIYNSYLSLADQFSFHPKSGLGGKLLYAGEINSDGRNLLYASNIAGAASLAASCNPSTQREAIRDGVVDFLVTNLEEALRILKNEIRKHETVSVGVCVSPSELTAEMIEHGVLPDMLAPAHVDLFSSEQKDFDTFLQQGAIQIPSSQHSSNALQYVSWSVDKNFARWLPKLDQCARTVIPEEDVLRQRWLRLAPRYLGRLAQREHGVALSASEISAFKAAVGALIADQATDPESKPELKITATE